MRARLDDEMWIPSGSDSYGVGRAACQVLLYTKSGNMPDLIPDEMSEKDKADMAALDADADRIEKEIIKQDEAQSASPLLYLP